jgi:GT2 family glycosyltransferase
MMDAWGDNGVMTMLDLLIVQGALIDELTAARPVPRVSLPAGTDLLPVQPLASIIIVSYNSRAHLERCLDAVFWTVGPECEVIVVDNASTDSSADFVAERFLWVKLIRSATNGGFAAGNNVGVAAARGHYVVGLNPDTVVTGNWLAALLAPLEAARMGTGPAIGITTPRILMLDTPDRVNTCGNLMHYTGLTLCRGLGLSANAPELAMPCAVPAVSGACFALSRELWNTLGGFDETFFTYLEDTDLSLRARLAGYECVYVPDAVVFHKYTNSFSSAKLYYLERNRLLLLYKCYGRGLLCLLLPALLLAEMITWSYALTRGRAGVGAKLRAYGWLLAHPAEVRAKRRQTQALRRVGDHAILGALVWPLNIAQLAGPGRGRLADRMLNPVFGFCYRAARIRRRA